MVERSMIEGTLQTAHASPRIDALLSHVSDTPKVATALLDALANHVDCKTRLLKKRAHTFESKWNMSFDEFALRVKAGRIARRVTPADAQHDLTDWEQTLGLLRHYQSLKVR